VLKPVEKSIFSKSKYLFIGSIGSWSISEYNPPYSYKTHNLHKSALKRPSGSCSKYFALSVLYFSSNSCKKEKQSDSDENAAVCGLCCICYLFCLSLFGSCQ